MDWISLLEDNFIYYVTSGKNTGKNEISVKCTWCGENDPSQHLGINLASGAYGCWRDARHRGKAPTRLVGALLGVGSTQANLIIQAYQNSPIDEFDETIPAQPRAAQLHATRAFALRTLPAHTTPQIVKYPDDFEPLRGIFCDYLLKRGIDNQLADYYCLACCRVGRWKQRVIIPVFDKNFKLLGWQGRAIVEPKKAPRYLTSHEQVKRTVFNLQNVNKGGEILYICEGPFDAMKLDYFGKPRIRATCSFGVTVTMEQIQLLSELCSKFSKVILMFDNDSAGTTGGFNLSDWLSFIEFANLPEDHKDTDKMDKDQLLRFLHG